MLRERRLKWVWTGHLVLAVLWPLVMGLAIGQDSPMLSVGLLAVYVMAPVVGYLYLLRGDPLAIPADEACVRSGTTVWGSHWFEFASQPEARAWTRDPEVAAEVRARPVPTWSPTLRSVARDHALLLHAPRARRQAEAMVSNLVAVVVSMGVGFASASLLGVGIMVFGSNVGGGILQSIAGAVFLCLFYGIIVLVPALVLFLALYGVGFGAAWWIWHRLWAPRPTAQIEWTGAMLKTEDGTVYLDDAGAAVRLSYDEFGAVLEVGAPPRSLILFGDHEVLASLAAALEERPEVDEGERARILAWSEQVRRRPAAAGAAPLP